MSRESETGRDDVEYYVRLSPAISSSRSLRPTLLGLTVVTAAAWALSFQRASNMTETMGVAAREMGMAAWSFAGAATFVVMWGLMMTAMMPPSTAPMVATFAAKQIRDDRSTAIPTLIFVAAYLFAWSIVGLIAYALVQAGSDAATMMAPADRMRWVPLFVGATLLAAGLYQFTPFKRACLRHCRSPFGFVLRQWQEGNWGALRMGLHHGAYCVGCCWALSAVLIAAGVISLAWMLLLTWLIFVERVLPQSRISASIIGVMFIGLGVAVGSGAVPMPFAG